jgi:RNA polymerase sigma factor (sigma-70 family)
MSAVSGSSETQRAVAAPGRAPLGVPRRILRLRSDAALAERFAAGDEAAFDVLYERHRPVVLAVAMGVLGTTQDAEDATQETFSALAVALQTKPPAELRPWLIRVARNASIDTTRRRRRRLLTMDGELPDVPARSNSAGKAELAVVLDGIRELPEGQRMALLMRELGGHSYGEIAEFLETDEEAVKGLIARARVGLRTYREATDLPCATARAAIASEPDGRRHDKTIRRHLRSCASCRSYRGALRDDAKALRAALPLPAGSVAAGGISTGMLTAAKGTLLGYGLTQAATSCAAAACGVGAIGGMVFVTPIHKFGLAPILKPAPVFKHMVIKTVPKPTHTVVLPVHESTPAVAPAVTHAVSAARQTLSDAPAVHRSATAHRQATSVTKVKLPPLHAHRTAAPPSQITSTHGSSPQQASNAPAASTVIPSAGNSGHGHGNGYGHEHQSTHGAPGSADSSTASWSAGSPTQSAAPTTGNGHSGAGAPSSGASNPAKSGSGTSNPKSHGQGQPGGGHHFGNPSMGIVHDGGPTVSGAASTPAASVGPVATVASSSSGSAAASSTGATATNGHGRANQSTAVGGPSGQASSSHGSGGAGHAGSSHGGGSHGGASASSSTTSSAGQQSTWTGYQPGRGNHPSH